jgi:predicted  nucleic acid-binding Zn-ribbon protein
MVTPNQLEENTKLSFSYVKKDLMRLNDAIADLNEKIQHLSLNQATLLGEVGKIRTKKVSIKKVKVKKKVKKAKKTSKKSKPRAKKVVKTETVTYS